jgi:hypothetical protein
MSNVLKNEITILAEKDEYKADGSKGFVLCDETPREQPINLSVEVAPGVFLRIYKYFENSNTYQIDIKNAKEFEKLIHEARKR